MTTYYLTKETECDHCNGRGLVQDVIWREFWNWFRSQDNQPTNMKVKLWWKEHGHAFDDTELYPPEEITCPYCKGDGVLESRTLLLDAITDPDIAEAINIMVGHEIS